jgi:HAD superfamily phosphatase
VNHFATVIFDIDGVIRDVGNSYRRALADTVEQFTQGAYRPTPADIDALKEEGIWNNDWEASQEFIYRHYEQQGRSRTELNLNYETIVDYFQRRYRGTDLENPDRWDGYITQEPLLLNPPYLQTLTAAGILWGFFSGATQGSARYILEKRLGLKDPVLVAMEDAPGKPNPTGLFQAIAQLETDPKPVLYVGDTVADMYTVTQARAASQIPQGSQQPDLSELPARGRQWIGVGVLPPHAQAPADYARDYARKLEQAGAAIVLNHVEQLNAAQILSLIQE